MYTCIVLLIQVTIYVPVDVRGGSTFVMGTRVCGVRIPTLQQLLSDCQSLVR
jgi:hypothetical protein